MHMRMRSLRLSLLLSCLLPVAWAGDAATPGLHADDDPAAVAWQAPPGQKAKFRELLNAELRRHPRNVSARVHRAYLLDRAGDHERAQRDYDAALEAASPNGLEHRHVLWSRGWSRYDMGDVPGALQDWRECVRLHGGRPYWTPYTFALAYWTQGDSAQALAWYAAAVASNSKWGTEAGMTDKTRHWRPEQRERMQALFEAWSATAAQPVELAPVGP